MKARIYILGTDKMGRDLWGKACEAGRISLSMSLFGAFISIALGSVIGVTSGYYGGNIDNAMQRFVEFVSMPSHSCRCGWRWQPLFLKRWTRSRSS
jgi:peptide/nickel transport system permease protein